MKFYYVLVDLNVLQDLHLVSDIHKKPKAYPKKAFFWKQVLSNVK